MIQSIRLARLNYKNDQKSYRIFLLLLIASLTSIFILIILVNGYVTLENSYKTDNISLREIQMWSEDSSSGVISFDIKKNQTISGLSGVEYVSQYYNVELQNAYDVFIDDRCLNCLPYIRGVNQHFSFASMSEIQKKGASPIIAGRNVTNSNNREALIDENICYLLDYSTPEEAIGKKIKIVFSDKEISEIEIVGVFSYQFSDYGYQLTEMDNTSRKSELEGIQSNPFYFSDGLLQEIITSEDVITWHYENLIVLCESTDYVKRICDYAQSACGYSSLSQINTIETKAERVRAISVFLLLLLAIVLLIAIIVILNSLSVKILHQRRFTEMLLKIGFVRKDIILSYVLQNVFISLKAGCISSIIAFLIGIFIDSFFQCIYKEVSEKAKFVFIFDFSSSFTIIVVLCVIIVIATWIEAMAQVMKSEAIWRVRHE